MNVGRNETCPCGSGKKYKKCCLPNSLAQEALDFNHRRFRDTERRLIERLFRHAAEVYGPTSIEEAWDEFHCWEYADEYEPDSPVNQVFGPYFLFQWEIDPFETACDLAQDGKTIAESYLAKNRSKLSAEEIEILQSANRSAFSFFEILDVTPGHGFSLRNVLTNVASDVVDHLGSKSAQRGNIIFGAVYHANGRNQVLAVSPYMLPPLAIQSLIEVRKDLLKRLKTKTLTDSQVYDFDIELRDVYFSLLEPLLNPRMPEFCNTDGDPLVPQKLYFEIEDPEAAFQALKPLAAGFLSEGELRTDAKLKGGRLVEIEIPWYKKNKSNRLPESNTILGLIKITGTNLTVEVNSDKRATAIKKKIQSALGDKVRFKTKLIESIEAKIGNGQAPRRSESSAVSLDQLPPEALEVVKGMAEAHWSKWFDEKIPALNGKTPIQAAKSKEGRELLEALLNHYQKRSGHANNDATNLFQPDVDKLRSKLGLTEKGRV